MPANGFGLTVSEYRLLSEALQHFRAHLEELSAASTDDDRQLAYDEKLQDMAGLIKSVERAAVAEYDLHLTDEQPPSRA
jgi:hypothetical protein